MKLILKYLSGAVFGYFIAVFIANMEDIPFYTFRSWISGKQDPVDVVHDPNDFRVVPIITWLFILLGVLEAHFLPFIMRGRTPREWLRRFLAE